MSEASRHGRGAAMSSLVSVEKTLRSARRERRHGAGVQMDAVRACEVDEMVSQLLEQIEVPFTSLGKKVLTQLSDLKQVLGVDYHEAPGMPPAPLLKELARIVETEVKGRHEIWKQWDNPECFAPLVRLFGPRELEVRAEPYRRGAGLSLRGFFCRGNLGGKPKFVIFLNTAHHPGAVAATFGHELGHYLYGSLIGENGPMTALMEGTFGTHLSEEHELFADALVALAAYNTDQIKQIIAIGKLGAGSSENLLTLVHKAYEAIGPRLKLDLKQERIGTSWRVSYLTSMIHFFKLRCTLLDHAGV
jgi:hypothetical protein